MRRPEFSQLLQQGDFGTLFRVEMGWDNPTNTDHVDIKDSELRPVPIVEKKGITAWLIECPNGMPERREQRLIVRDLKKRSRDQLVLFTTEKEHWWLWPEQRSSGFGFRLVDHKYSIASPSEALIQRLHRATFTPKEEGSLTSSDVLSRVRNSFNADKVTKSFYREFQKHHKNFATKIEGLESEKDRSWYASVLLNRLMFIYFIQQKGFLDGDREYLRNRLEKVREHFFQNRHYAFFQDFLPALFHQGLGNPDPVYREPQIKELVGSVPYVNGGIFERHDLELNNDLRIKDDAFEELFEFFDKWKWHLDDNHSGDEKEINPDILGFIFEQYINFTDKGQKESGAYYTKPDVTGYMAASTILPAIADRLVEEGLESPALLLKESKDDYIHDSILHGVDRALPEEWNVGNSEPSGNIALPGERWCEVTHRRSRHKHLLEMLSERDREWTIDDAITENLDLRELLTDYMTLLNSPEECDKAFDVLRSLTICDPTVGSGAFLFAALEVLQPLYEIVVERARELAKSGKGSAACLIKARQHHSQRYWILKTLCLNNLYGVDLMREAPEIAKLRLFLKLVAQLDEVGNLEPLPDLDFNIKSGNLLVGIADEQDALERLANGRFDFGGEIEEIQGLAKEVASHQRRFVGLQSSDVGAVDHSKAKQDLSVQLDLARGKADHLLHKLRKGWQQRKDRQQFAKWRDSHQPFHWFVEFPSVWAKGGFDVVIGNPPYIKKSEVRGYTWTGFKTESCPDLFALCVERASSLVNAKGRFSMIVMHSLCFSRAFKSLRLFLQENLSSIWVSSFSRIPDSIFSGSARVRNSILVATTGVSSKILTSSCRRWQAISRPHLFEGIQYIQPSPALFKCGTNDQWPFIDSAIIARSFAQMAEENHMLGKKFISEGPYKLAYKKVCHYMMGVSLEPAPTRGKKAKPNYEYLYFSEACNRDIALLILAGRWGYLWWFIFGDDFHVTQSTLTAFPSDMEKICAAQDYKLLSTSNPGLSDIEIVNILLALSRSLHEEMPKTLAWKKNGPEIFVGRYNMLKLRHITDEADLILAKLWGIEFAYEAAGNWRDRVIFGNND